MLHHLGRLESGGCYHLLRNSEAEWGLPYLQESIKKQFWLLVHELLFILLD